MIIVGLTGSVGTGKSTVASFFRELGAYVIDWDELARKITRPHSRAWRKIVDNFGKGILNDDCMAHHSGIVTRRGRLAYDGL